jgi:branched-chain amino acid transport system substrate-binding protein
MKRRFAYTAVTAAVAVAAAACSSQSSSLTGGSSSGPASPASGAATSAPKLSGTPVHIVSIDDGSDTLPFTDVSVAIKAIVTSVNASGGINGHPLEYTICTTNGGDNNVGAQCARAAAADPSVVAVVGEWSQTGTTVNPILEQAKMASIGLFPQASSDYTSPVAFPVSSGTVGIVAGMVTLATDVLKAKTIGLAYTSSPQGAALQQLLQPIAKAHGAQLTKTTAIPAGAADVSSNVEASADGTNAVALSTRAQDSVKYIQAASQLGIATPLVAPANFDASLIKLLPGGGSGLYFSDSFLREGPSYNAYKAQISAVDPSQVSSLRTINVWVAAQAFIAAAKTAKSLTRAGILAAVQKLTSFSDGGITPALDFAEPASGSLPRLFNQTVTYNKMSAGVLMPISSQFHDVFAAS